MSNNDVHVEWRKRFRAVARSQGRHLWLLLITAVFYLALDSTVSRQAQPGRQQLPVVGIEVSSGVVWASGSLVLGFISLAALGTFPALTYAYSMANPAKREDYPFESLDTEPTAIDFLVYATPGNDAWRRLALVTYPLFITFVVLESAWLWVRLLASKPSTVADFVFLVCGGAFTLACFIRLGKLWKSKITSMIKKRDSQCQAAVDGKGKPTEKDERVC